MQQSLKFLQGVPCVPVYEELTGKIVAAGRQERLKEQRRRQGLQHFVLALRGLAYAAGILLMAGWSFRAALETNLSENQAARSSSSVASVASTPSPEAIRRATWEVRMLEAALEEHQGQPISLAEWRYRRAARVLDSDLRAALATLEKNPGHMGATSLVNASLRRQVDTLKKLYIERTL